MSKKKHRRDHGRVCLENLESRLLMAGDVTVAVDAHGNLTVTGDALGNGIVMTKAANAVTVAPDAETTVNGGALGVPVVIPNVVGKITLSMGDGDDDVTIGAADDTFLAGDDDRDPAEGLNPENLLVDLGDGDDTLDIFGLRARDVTVRSGAGEDEISILDNGGGEALESPSFVYGNLVIVSDEGVNAELAGVDVAKDCTITLGDGTNTVLIREDTTVGTRQQGEDSTFGSLFGGNLTITGGRGDDDITIRCNEADTAVAGDLTVKLYGSVTLASNTLMVSDVDVGGSLLYVGGSGGDDVIFGGNVYVARDASLDMKGGPNLFNSTDVTLVVGQDLTYKGGAGVDTLLGVGADVFVGRDLTIRGEGGADAVTAADGDLWVGRNATVNLGRGDDSLVLSDGVVDGNAAFNLGAGNDIVVFAGSGTFLFLGGFTVLGAAGFDIVQSEDVHLVVNRDATLDLGAGAGVLDLNGEVDVAGGLTYTGGSGNDALTLAGGSWVGGNAQFQVGGGDNLFNVPGDLGVVGGFAYTGGSGIDTLVFDGDGWVGGDVRINAGSGDNELDITAGLIVDGGFAYFGGRGTDTLALTGLGIIGQTRINTGGGDDVVSIYDDSLLNGLTVNTGRGDDLMYLGDNPDREGGWDYSAVGGTLRVSMDGGDDLLFLGWMDTGESTLLLESSVLNGGSGIDFVTFGDVFQAFQPLLLNWETPDHIE